MEYQIKTAGLSLKDVDVKKGVVSGYFSSFGNVDADGDIIMPGAFTKTIRENFNRIKHLMNHNVYQPLGKLLKLVEDDKGLYYESQIGQHTLGQDFLKMAEGGLITEHSVGFKTIKKEFDANHKWDADGVVANGVHKIYEVKMWEGSSLTAWGANPMTPLTEMKGKADVEDLNKRIKALVSFVRNTDASDDTIQLLLLQIKQLQQVVIDLTTEPQVSTQPETKQINDEQLLQIILKHF